MKLCLRWVLLAGILQFATSALASAQVIRRIAQPIGEAEFDLGTGTVTSRRAGKAKAAPGFNTCTSFQKTTLSGFTGVDTGSGACAWIQKASKTQGKTTYVTSFRFAYCSAALDVNSGGTGGRTRIGFREGYTVGAANSGGPTGTEVAFFNLSALPANSKSSGFMGGTFCTFILVGLGSDAFCLPDGGIAYSWEFVDLGTDGVFAATFPFFACVASCSGPLAFPPGSTVDGAGANDLIDSYCPPTGAVTATFSFGTSTSGFNFTALNMELREAEHILATQTIFNPTVGSVTNPLILTTGVGPILKGSFGFTLDCSGASPGAFYIGRASFAPPPPPVSTKYGNLLVSGAGGAATGLNFFGPHGGSVVPLMLPLPFDINAFGACFPLQMMCGDSPFGYLSNAILARVGSL